MVDVTVAIGICDVVLTNLIYNLHYSRFHY